VKQDDHLFSQLGNVADLCSVPFGEDLKWLLKINHSKLSALLQMLCVTVPCCNYVLMSNTLQIYSCRNISEGAESSAFFLSTNTCFLHSKGKSINFLLYPRGKLWIVVF